MSAFSANFEGAEVLVPFTLGRHGFRLAPSLQLVQIIDGDFAVFQSFKQVVAKRFRKTGPLDLWHLLAEGHSGKFLFEPLLCVGVFRMDELLGESEEPLFFAFLRIKTLLNQSHQQPVGAETPRLGKLTDPSGQSRGHGNTTPYGLF